MVLFRIRITPVLVLLACVVALGCGGEETEPRDRADHCPARDELTCAVDIGGTFPLLMSGTTTATGPDEFTDVSCSSGGGAGIPDAAFRWTAPWAGRFRITTEGSAFDTTLSIREGSCGRELMCNDDIERGVNTQSMLLVDVDDCETLTIVVDGYDGAAFGDYEFSITGVETACGDGSDDDLDGAVDCDDDDCGFTIECIDDNPGEWPTDLTEQEFRVLELTNEARARGANCGGEDFPAVGPLEAEPRLRTSARLHSKDMADNDYFSHDSQDGRMLGDRVRATGHPGGLIGENIAFGQSDAAEVVQGWLDSPGHCRNMMNGGYRYLGVGAARNPSGRIYWTQNFSGEHVNAHPRALEPLSLSAGLVKTLAGMFAAVILGACTADTVPIRVQVDDSLGAVRIAAGLFSDVCPAPAALDEGMRFQLAAGVPLPITDDTRAVAVWAVDSSCAVVGFGCAELQGRAPIIVSVTATSRIERCDGSCDGTRCVDLDAGTDADTGTDLGEDTSDMGEPDVPCPEGTVESDRDADDDGQSNALECCGDTVEDCLAAVCVSLAQCDEFDSDGDEIPDYLDSTVGLDPGGDADGDGIPNQLECCPAGAECCSDEGCMGCIDSDRDGSPDFFDSDSDDDGVSDSEECSDGCFDHDEDGFLSFRDWDSDNDGVSDGAESEGTRTDPERCAPEDACDLCVCPARHSCVDEVNPQCTPSPEMVIDGNLDCESALQPFLAIGGELVSGPLQAPRCDSPAGFTFPNLPNVGTLSPGLAVGCRVGVCLWRFDLVLRAAMFRGPIATSDDQPIFAVNVGIGAATLRRLFPEVESWPEVETFGRGYTHLGSPRIRLRRIEGLECGVGC